MKHYRVLLVAVAVSCSLFLSACSSSKKNSPALGDNNSTISYKSPTLVNLGVNTKCVFDDATANCILPTAVTNAGVQYAIIPKGSFDSVVASEKSIVRKALDMFRSTAVSTKSDVTLETDVLDVVFSNPVANGTTNIVTIKQQFPSFPGNRSAFAKRYILAFYNGTEWIPAYNCYQPDVDPQQQFTGDFKVDSSVTTLKIAIISEQNFVKSNGTIGITNLMKFWHTNMSAQNWNGTSVWIGNEIFALSDSGYGVATYEIETPVYSNWMANFYFDNDQVTYYKYGEKKTISFSNYQVANDNGGQLPAPCASVDIVLDGTSAPVTYFEGATKQLKIHINNSETIDGNICIYRDQSVVQKTYIGTAKDFTLNIPANCWNYVINAPGYYYHAGRCLWGGDQLTLNYISQVTLMPHVDESGLFESDSALSTIFTFTDTPNDAPDGTAGPGYYNYPSNPVMNQHSFDIDHVVIKEGSTTYQFEVYPTKPIFQAWALGFDIYMKFKTDLSPKTATILGRNVDFAAGDGWTKAVVLGNMYGFDSAPLDAKYDLVAEIANRNPGLAADIVVGNCRSGIGSAVVYTILKSDIGSVDLKTQLSGIQILSYGQENHVYEYNWVTAMRLVNRTNIDEWHSSCNQANFNLLHSSDASRSPIPHLNEIFNWSDSSTPYPTWLYTKLDTSRTTDLNNDAYALNPYVLDILDGKAADGSTVSNAMLDTFTTAPGYLTGNVLDWGSWDRTKFQFAQIKMVKVQ